MGGLQFQWLLKTFEVDLSIIYLTDVSNLLVKGRKCLQIADDLDISV